MNKKELRKEFKNIRDNIKKRDLLSHQIGENLFESDLYKNARSIFTFISFRSEVETFEIIKRALEDKKIVTVPKVQGKDMKVIKIYSLDNLKRSPLGILEPENDDEFYNVDITLTPGLAFSKDGYRLGYGGGYYDRFFAKYRTKKVGLAFYDQLTDKIPKEEFDQKLDYLVTEKEIIEY